MDFKEFYSRKTVTEDVDQSVYDTAVGIVKRIRSGYVKETIGRDGKPKKVRKRFPETFFVGGWVRDKLLGMEAKDIDIATEAKPDEVREILKGERFIEKNEGEGLGQAFNVIMVMINGHQYEIVTFRGEGKYTDGRRPDLVYFSNPEEDAKRRDFTVNALFYDPVEDKYIDYVGGKKDIEKGLLKAIGEPVERYREDYLRMLRAIRFFAQKGLEIEKETFDAIIQNAHQINKTVLDGGKRKYSISRERVKEELNKILISGRPGLAIQKMLESGLLQELFPEIVPVLDPMIPKALDASDRDLELRWAILLYGTGRTIDSKRFRYERQSAENALKILKKYTFDTSTIKNVAWLIQNQNVFHEWGSLSHIQKNRIMTHALYPKLLKYFKIIGTSYDENEVTAETLGLYDKKKAEFEKLIKDRERFEQMRKFSVVTGNDLISLGIRPGPIHGKILKDLEEKYSSGELKTREELLGYVKKKYVGNTLSDGTVMEPGI